MNIVELFAASVNRDPLHPCVQFKDAGNYRSLTYEATWRRIQQLAYALKSQGLGAGDKVAILGETSWRWLIADLAIQSLGAVVVPIYPSLPPRDAAFILENAEVSWLFADHPHQVNALADLWPGGMKGAVLIEDDPLPASGSLPVFVKGVISFTFQELIQSAQSVDAVMLGLAVQPQRVASDAVATIVHTSGTSGKPKGVVLTHANLVANIEACLSTLSVLPDDVALSFLPLSHILERTVGHYCILTAGATIAYSEGLEAIQQNLTEVRPTLLVTVPRLLEKVYAGIQEKLDTAPSPIRKLLKSGMETGGGLGGRLAEKLVYAKVREGLGRRMRTVVSGGAGLAADIGRFFEHAGIPILEGYGMTETAPVIAVNRLNQIRFGTVGLPVSGVEVRIADDGELLVRGPNVMQGYYRNEAATAEVLDLDGWLHTGDIAEMEDGYIRIVDRKKHLLVLATGKNVAPAPIESAITLQPSIADAVVVGDGRKYVTCLIVPDFDALSQPAGRLELATEIPEIRRQLQRELRQALDPFAEFERPKRAVLLAEPFSIESGELTPTLKVKAKVVRDRYRDVIDDMYEGRNYLDIDGAVEAGLPQVDTEHVNAVNLKPIGRVRKGAHRWGRGKWIGLGAVILVCATGTGTAMAGVKPPKHLNLLSSIQHIGQNNQKINRVNSNILAGMSKVNNLSSLTPKMATQLKQLDSGLGSQNDTLSQLEGLSQREISLSQQFGTLANEMNTSLQSIQSSTLAQAAAVEQMAIVASQMEQRANQLEATNTQLATKLKTANARTQTVAAEVP